MIKARLDRTDGQEGHVLLFGLSYDDMQELLKGKAVELNTKEFGLADQEILIVGGADESAIVSELDLKFGILPGSDKRKP